MGFHRVIAFLKGLHRKLPVGGQDGGIPPIHFQLIGIAGIETVSHRTKAFDQRRRAVVEINECAARPEFHAAGLEIDFGPVEQLFIEHLLAKYESVLALGVPAPAVERADKAGCLAIAWACGKPNTAVAAGIMECLYTGFGVDHDNGLFEYRILHIVPDLGDFFETAGHLPDMRPQLFLLQFKEGRIKITLRRDKLRIGDPVGNRFERTHRIVSHTFSHSF